MQKTSSGTNSVKQSPNSIDPVDFVLQTYFSLDPRRQQILMNTIKRRMRQLGFDQTTINSFGSNEIKQSSNSTIDSSPLHIRKTTSLINQQKVNQFIILPQLKPKSISQQEISLYQLQKELPNEDPYIIPSKFRSPQKEKEFKLKIITPLRFLGIAGHSTSYKCAFQSRDSIKRLSSHLIKQVQNLGLFYLDLVSIQDISKQFKKKLLPLNNYLIFKIEIGMKFIRQNLLKIFDIHWQNLIEIVLERIWTPNGEKQHGLDFFIDQKNTQKIKKILLLGNKLTTKFSQSLNNIKLPSLEVLEMNFETQVDHQELEKIFANISKYNNKFEIHLVTSVKNKNEFPPFLIENYGERIYLVDRRLKLSENLQRQRNIEKAKYKKPSYQIKFEEEEKWNIQNPKYKKPQVVNKPIFDEVISRESIVNSVGGTRSEELARSQTGSVGSNEIQSANRTVFGQSQNFSNINVNVSGKLENLKMGTTQQTIKQQTIYQQNTQHHHHHVQKIVQQQIIRQLSERHYETEHERGYRNRRGRGGRSYYGGNRRQQDSSDDDSSDDEPDYRTGYQFYGRNNYKYNKNYNNYNKGNGYSKQWFED